MRVFHRLSTAHDDLIHDVSYDFYGKRLATCSSDQKIKVWDQNDNQKWELSAEWKAHSGSVWKLAWAHPEYGQVIASCSFDRTVCIWEESEDEKGQKKWQLKAHLVDSRDSVTDIKFAPKSFGLRLATCSSDGYIRIYEAMDIMNLSQWTIVEEFESQKGTSNCISWNPSSYDKPMIAVGSNEPYIKIWEYSETARKWLQIDTLTAYPIGSTISSSNLNSGIGGGIGGGGGSGIGGGIGGASSIGGVSGVNNSSMNNLGSGIGGGNNINNSNISVGVGSGVSGGGVGSGVGGSLNNGLNSAQGNSIGNGNIGSLNNISGNSGGLNNNSLMSGANSSINVSSGNNSIYSNNNFDSSSDGGSRAIHDVCWAPNMGRSYHLIATASKDHKVRIWKLSSDKSRMELKEVMRKDDHKSEVWRVEWNITGTILASSGDDGNVCLWKCNMNGEWKLFSLISGEESTEDKYDR
ncbi:hypothetical protein ACTFIW_004085 [Dictyostelium discoideum]